MDTSRSLEDFGETLRRFRDQELRERLAALAVDYETADQDEFVVQSVEEDRLTLRRAVPLPGLPDELAPVRAPAGAAKWLRPDDILNLELVRDAERWEILDVMAVVPGGYAE